MAIGTYMSIITLYINELQADSLPSEPPEKPC